MSTSNPSPGAASVKPNPVPAPAAMPQAPKPAPPPAKREVRIISHCTLFYWWPVWACGFIMFFITMYERQLMVTVPPGTTAWTEKVKVPPTEDDKKFAKSKNIDENMLRDALTYPLGVHIPPDPSDKNRPENPHLHMTSSKNLGVLFVSILLLVIAITNIPLRGLWSAIVIGLIVCFVLLAAWQQWWDSILTYLNFLDIRINAAGYLVISAVLFALWLLVVFLFDRQIYLVLAPGQLRVRKEIGGAEDIYDTTNMKVQKQRNDFFRHWILGIGSGDLIVKPANSEEIHMPNVLFIGFKVKKIEEMLEIRQVEAPSKPTA